MRPTRREWLEALPGLCGAARLLGDQPKPQPGDWPIFRGDARRNAAARGGPPSPTPRWRHPLVTWESDADARDADAWLAGRTDSSAQAAVGRDRPVLPPFAPVAVGGRVVAASHHGLRAVTVADGELAFAQPTRRGLFRLARDPSARAWLERLLDGPRNRQRVPPPPEYPPPGDLFLDDTLVGALASDGRLVFFLDSLALPGGKPIFPAPPFAGPLSDADLHGNSLEAAALDGGKLVWVCGGDLDVTRERPFDASFFLGPPLPLDGRAYVLGRKDHELRLTALDAATAPRDSRVNRLLWQLPIDTLAEATAADPASRRQALHLAADAGLLVAPSPDGGAFGVDPVKRQVVWAHRPAPAAGPPPPAVRPGAPRPGAAVGEPAVTWRAPTPVVADGRVILTLPGSEEVVCLNLVDGKPLWKAPRGDDLFLAAVAEGNVVLVGPTHCRALKLADGSPVWRTEAGVPAGQGAALDGGRYLLPLRSAVGTKKPAFALLDLRTGALRETVPVTDADDLGNLVVHRGLVVAQSLKRLTAFPLR
jgi:hypothetical protein